MRSGTARPSGGVVHTDEIYVSGVEPPQNHSHVDLVGVDNLRRVHIELVTLVVDDYDPAIAFFVDVLGFDLVDDSRP